MRVGGQKVLSLETLEPGAVSTPEYITNVVNLTLGAIGDHAYRGETRIIEREADQPIHVTHIIRVEPH